MKKLLNPSLNTKEVTVLDEVSSDDEKPKIDTLSSKKKKGAVVRSSVLHPAKGKKSLQSVEDSSQHEPKLSTIFLELRNELLEQQQEKKTKVSYDEDQLLIDEATPAETNIQENPSMPDISINLLEEDADIFRKLNIPWMPTDVQNTTAGKVFDSDKQNL